MKSLILVVGVFGSVLGLVWGYPYQVQDTPEVAAAKAAHLSALAEAHQAAHHHSWEAQDRSWDGGKDWKIEPSHEYQTEDDGSWKEDESTWAQESHSWAPQTHHESEQHWNAPQKKWTGPIALPPGYDKHGAPLPVLDTPEVAAEKARHFHLYAHGAHAALAAYHS